MNIKEIFQNRKAKNFQETLAELDAQIDSCLYEQRLYEEELEDVSIWLDSWEHSMDMGEYIDLAQDRLERYDELIFLLHSSDLLFDALMKKKATLLENTELVDLVDAIAELHERMIATENKVNELLKQNRLGR